MLLFKKSLFISCFTVLLLVSCSPKKQNSFRISGKITQLKNSQIVVSKIEDIQNQKTIVIDTLQSNKRGEFNAVYFFQPGLYTVEIDSKKIPLAIATNQHIVIKGTDENSLKFKGSNDTDLLNQYEEFRKESLNRLVNSVRNEINTLKTKENSEKEIIELRALEVENYTKHLNELVEFVKNKMGTSIAIYATASRWNSENLPFLKELVLQFEEKYGAIEITQQLKDKIMLLEKTSTGSIISNIKMPTINGDIVALNSVKKTYTLIDFWASWCPPCRTESILLNKLYNTYNSKGFEIYGISLDSSKERWLKALENDNRTWVNVSSIEGFNTPIAQEYGITALPTNFLIDTEGKIIAVNIHGVHLKEKIEKLFD